VLLVRLEYVKAPERTYDGCRVIKLEVARLWFRARLPIEERAERAEDRLIGLLKSIDSANKVGSACQGVSVDRVISDELNIPVSVRRIGVAICDLPSAASRPEGGWPSD
jgi:hypothetical protein